MYHFVLTLHPRHLSSPLTSLSNTSQCLHMLRHTYIPPHSIPVFFSFFFFSSSCLWKTPRRSCLDSRGTQTPTASGHWLSHLCQVCQVCVCDVTGKTTPMLAQCSAWRQSQHGTRNGPPRQITSSSHAALKLVNGSL